MKHYDVLIVGAGMVGLSLALRLARSNLSVAIVDQGSPPSVVKDKPSLRVSALNTASCQVLEHTGAWQQLERDRLGVYEQMSVWDQDSFGSIHFSAHEVQQKQLGYIIENSAVIFAQFVQLQSQQQDGIYFDNTVTDLNIGQHEAYVQLSSGQAITAKLLVGADGNQSFVRKAAALPSQFWDYQQQGIVTTIRTELPHENCARQAFTPSGPLGVLPLWDAHQMSIVWSQDNAIADEIMQLDDVQFCRRLQKNMDNRLGLVEVLDQRQAFPLSASYTRQWAKERVVLVGDAAHRFHPLAGQGANLGIADAEVLYETLVSLHEAQKDIGCLSNLRQFERDRKHAAATMIGAMEGFKQLFSSAHPLKKIIRGMGLNLVDNLPMVKEKMIKHAMGLD